MADHRGKRRLMGRHRGEAPDTSFVHGPNQLWTWDFTKVPTGIPHQCWYMVAVEDQYGRKAAGWTMSALATTEFAKTAWDAALPAEGLPAAQMPFSLPDPDALAGDAGFSSKTLAWPGSLHGRGCRTTTPTSSRCFPQSRPTTPSPRPSPPSKRRGRVLSRSFTATITSIFTCGLE